MNKYKYVFFMSAVIMQTVFTSCTKEEEKVTGSDDYRGVFVVNEGGFGKSNGSIGLFKKEDNTYFDAFRRANGRPLGDVVQSMSLINGRFYIVVNNSNKVEVVSSSDFSHIATISTVSPRYIIPVSQNKAYLSNLYSNTVKVVNLADNSVSSSVDIHHNSEHMALMDQQLFVGTFSNKIMVVDTRNDSLTDSIQAFSGLSRIVNAGSGKLAVLCTGLVDWNSGAVIEKGKILLIGSDSNRIQKSYELSTGSYGGSLVYMEADQSLYFSLGDNYVYKMAPDGTITEFINMGTGSSVYGLSADQATNIIYVTDARDFNSAGKVKAYNLSGVKQYEFDAGIAPNAVLIKN